MLAMLQQSGAVEVQKEGLLSGNDQSHLAIKALGLEDAQTLYQVRQAQGCLESCQLTVNLVLLEPVAVADSLDSTGPDAAIAAQHLATAGRQQAGMRGDIDKMQQM